MVIDVCCFRKCAHLCSYVQVSPVVFCFSILLKKLSDFDVGNGGAEPKARQSESSEPHNVRQPCLDVKFTDSDGFLYCALKKI